MAGPNVSDKVRASGGARLADMKKTQQQESELYGVGSGLSVDELAMLRSGGESQANINLLNELRKSQQIQQARARRFNPTLGQMVRDIGTPAGALGAANGLTFGLPAAAYNAMQSPEGKQAFKEWQFQNPGFGYGTSAGDLATWAIPGGAMLKGAGRVAGAVGAGETAANLANAGRYLQGPMSLGTMLGQAAEQGVPRLAASAINGELDGGAAAGASLAALPFLGKGGVVVSDKVFPMAEDLYKMVTAKGNEALAARILAASPQRLGPETKLFNPDAVAQLQGFRLSGQGKTTALPLKDRPIVDLADLNGKTVVPIPADRTVAGITHYDLGGIPLKKPVQGPDGKVQYVDSEVQSLGGEDYWRQPNSITKGHVFASTRPAAHAMQNKFVANPNSVGMTMVMDHDGSNFATHTTESLLSAIPAIDKMSPQAIEEIDNAIRARVVQKKNGKAVVTEFPDFVGVKDPKWIDQIRGINGYQAGGIGELRKRIASVLDKSLFKYAGAPTTSMAHEMLNDPIIPAGYGHMGRTLVLPDTSITHLGQLGPTNHPAYNTHVPGTALGGMQSTVPWEVIYKDVIDKNPGKSLKDMYRTAQTTGEQRYLPVINDALIKRVDDYQGFQRPQQFSLGSLK